MCWLFHKWTKWGDKGTGKLASGGDIFCNVTLSQVAVIGRFTLQERRCTVCNKLQSRLEKVYG